jgi:hypothetical protein
MTKLNYLMERDVVLIKVIPKQNGLKMLYLKHEKRLTDLLASLVVAAERWPEEMSSVRTQVLLPVSMGMV